MKHDQKQCTSCTKILHISYFSPNSNSKNKYTSHCKTCRAEKEANRRKDAVYNRKIKEYKANPINRDRTKDRALKRIFGISLNEYETMFRQQNGVCAICFKEEIVKIRSLAVDHCHKTGKVRGLLCTPCNQGIGHLKDDVALLENAIRYLKERKT